VFAVLERHGEILFAVEFNEKSANQVPIARRSVGFHV